MNAPLPPPITLQVLRTVGPTPVEAHVVYVFVLGLGYSINNIASGIVLHDPLIHKSEKTTEDRFSLPGSRHCRIVPPRGARSLSNAASRRRNPIKDESLAL